MGKCPPKLRFETVMCPDGHQIVGFHGNFGVSILLTNHYLKFVSLMWKLYSSTAMPSASSPNRVRKGRKMRSRMKRKRSRWLPMMWIESRKRKLVTECMWMKRSSSNEHFRKLKPWETLPCAEFKKWLK